MSDNNVLANVPLTKVTLYKHGMGYFERRSSVTGPATVELQCGPDEIDDMLKSLIVLREGGGKVSAVTYESSKPLAERLSEFGFDLSRAEGLAALLGQIKGTPVSVKTARQEIAGRIVGVDSANTVCGDGVAVERFLLIMSQDHVVSRVNFSAIEGLEIRDKPMAEELQQQLELLFLKVRKKDRKLLKVDIKDSGEHMLTIAYSIPSPIWKTSYRLVFNEDEKLLLQGLAIVDNIQEEDWSEVRMVLVSAAPVSFIQPLYEPIKPARRTISAQGVSSSGPFVAERARRDQAFPRAPGAPPMGGAMMGKAAPAPMQAQAMMYDSIGEITGGHAAWSEPETSYMANIGEEQLNLEASQKGELFEYKIGEPVTVPRNSSALIPVVQQYVEGERVSLYQEKHNQDFPYATVRLKNTTELTLEAGPVTVMEEGAYAGECLLDVVKPDDTRFLPYALDQSVSVVTKNELDRKPIWKLRLANSILYMYNKEISTKSYDIENLSDKKKIVYIEHLLETGWDLIETQKPEETTKNYVRFRVEVEGKNRLKLPVSQERTVSTTYHMHGLDPAAAYTQWILAQNYSNEKFKTLLLKVQALRQELLDTARTLQEITTKIAELENAQKRARENVKSLGGESGRFKKTIEEIEDQIVAAQKQLDQYKAISRAKTDEFNKLITADMEAEILHAAPQAV